MINNEIRNGILLFLYNKFYDGRFYDQLITDVEVLPQLGIPVESLGVTHKNLAYLEGDNAIRASISQMDAYRYIRYRFC